MDSAGRIILEAGHRIVAEAVSARIFADPEHREAVDVKADDFDGVSYYVCVAPEAKQLLRVSIFAPCFAEVHDAVGDKYFQDLYPGMVDAAQPGYSLTLSVDLDKLPAEQAEREALVKKLSTMKRDVVGAPLWVSCKALLTGSKPPRSFYAVHYRPHEALYVVPSDDVVLVAYSIAFENHVEQAVARVFLQEIEISRRQSRDLATAPSVTYTHDAPHELKQLKGLEIKETADGSFIGFVSLAISRRSVEGGKLEKVVTLAEAYRSFLMYHVQGTKSQLHTRIRGRSSTWLQVLNRAMPEKLNVEKKTIKGRTFKR